MPGPLGRHSELSIEYVPIRALQPSEKNSRLHPRKQIEKLARAIFDFGFLIPVLVDAENKLIAGHARVEAAEVCGLSAIPCVRTSHLSEAQKRAFAIVDNRLAEDSTWNFQLLAKEFEFLQAEGIDLETTGFEIPEFDVIFAADDIRHRRDHQGSDVTDPAARKGRRFRSSSDVRFSILADWPRADHDDKIRRVGDLLAAANSWRSFGRHRRQRLVRRR